MQSNIISKLFIGQNFFTLAEVDSTNSFLKRLLTDVKLLPEGTVILAVHQHAGRGQQQSKWYSEPGKNLTFSVLLKPVFLLPTQQFDLAMAVGLAIVHALEPLLGQAVKIKWPNDIYFGTRKLGGMLIENSFHGSSFLSSIVGIGLNINQDKFPSAISNAISVKKIVQRDCDIQTILAQICTHLEIVYGQLKSGSNVFIRACYSQKLYRLNQLHNFSYKDESFKGVIAGVNQEGQLLVQQGGMQRKFNLKEIRFVD